MDEEDESQHSKLHNLKNKNRTVGGVCGESKTHSSKKIGRIMNVPKRSKLCYS